MVAEAGSWIAHLHSHRKQSCRQTPDLLGSLVSLAEDRIGTDLFENGTLAQLCLWEPISASLWLCISFSWENKAWYDLWLCKSGMDLSWSRTRSKAKCFVRGSGCPITSDPTPPLSPPLPFFFSLLSLLPGSSGVCYQKQNYSVVHWNGDVWSKMPPIAFPLVAPLSCTLPQDS